MVLQQSFASHKASTKFWVNMGVSISLILLASLQTSRHHPQLFSSALAARTHRDLNRPPVNTLHKNMKESVMLPGQISPGLPVAASRAQAFLLFRIELELRHRFQLGELITCHQRRGRLRAFFDPLFSRLRSLQETVGVRVDSDTLDRLAWRSSQESLPSSTWVELLRTRSCHIWHD